VWRWDQQEPFGDNVPNEDPDGDSLAFSFPFRFPGQRYDTESGLFYNLARDYTPSLGRYVESDPLGLEGGGANTYSYANLDPLTNSDPFGLFFWGHHIDITRSAASKICPGIAGGLAHMVAEVDYLKGSQSVRNAFWHGMRGPNQTVDQAARKYGPYINENLKSCSLEGLARALHGVQDSFAVGHRGYKVWYGSPGAQWADGWKAWRSHLWNDAVPGSTGGQAEKASEALIQAFKQLCPCKCR